MKGLALATNASGTPADVPGLGQGQTGHQAQQAGLADAIRSGDTQQLAGLEAEGEVAKQQAIALQAGEVFNFKHGAD